MMKAGIRAIEYVLPEGELTNEYLAALYEGWTAQSIFDKTGIVKRHIASETECVSDLAERAARKLFFSGVCSPEMIDFVLLITQTPDHILPTSACLLQARLGIPQTAGALDINLACSAYVYGLTIAKALVQSGVARNVLLLTAETYSKYIHPMDKTTRTIFGDAAAASLICDCEEGLGIGEIDYGTDGSGYESFIVPAGGARMPRSRKTALEVMDHNGAIRSANHLFMDGPDILTFALRVVPQTVSRVLAKAGKSMEDIDVFIFHQANAFILSHLRKKLKIPEHKFFVCLEDTGNTASSSLPIAVKRAEEQGVLKDGMTALLAGYGAGLSWGAAIVQKGALK